MFHLDVGHQANSSRPTHAGGYRVSRNRRAVAVGNKAPVPGLVSQVPGGAVPTVPLCPRAPRRWEAVIGRRVAAIVAECNYAQAPADQLAGHPSAFLTRGNQRPAPGRIPDPDPGPARARTSR